MARYNLAWNAPSRTIIMVGADTEVTGDSTVVSQLVYGAEGEVPDSASHPEPHQHLKNVAKQQGVDEFRIVTVVNQTDNPRLDKFEQEADEELLQQLQTAEADKTLVKPSTGKDDEASANADKVGPIGSRHADDGSDPERSGDDAYDQEQETADDAHAGGENGEAVPLTDEEKAGNAEKGIEAYDAITVKQLQEKLGSQETDKQTLYREYMKS